MSRLLKAYAQASRLNARKPPVPWKPRFLEASKQPSIPFPLKDRFQPKRINLAYYLGFKQGDLVEVLFGKDQGKQGVILKIDSRKNTVLVEGCNLQREPLSVGKHRDSSTAFIEVPLHVTNVALVDPVLKRPTRVKNRVMLNGQPVRISKISGSAIPPPVPPSLLSSTRDVLNLHRKLRSEGPPMKKEYIETQGNQLKILKGIAKALLSKST